MINTSDQLCARSGDSDVAFNPWLCASTITENQWYYFSFIHNGTANQDYLYLNGQLIDNDTGNTDVSGLETPRGIVIGENWENEGASDHYFPGRLDQIRVFGYAHSSSQIAWNYNQGKPVGWWKLNECQGGTAYDSGSGGNNGTITVGGSGSNTSLGTCSSGTGTEAWNNGTIGKRNASLDFDGTDDWVDLQDTNDQTTNDLTLSAWIKTDSSSAYQYIIAKGDHRGDQSQPFYSMRIDQTTGYATGLIRDNANTGYATVTGTTDLSDGVWHHVLVVYDRSSNAELFIDGKSENTASISGESATLDSGVDLALGVRYNTGSNGLWFNGQIDEVKVFNYALTEQQILTTFREGAVKF